MDTRHRILRATVELVREQGVPAVSFREVARRAQVSRQAPYYHFGDHHGVLRAVAAEGYAELTQRQATASMGASDPLQALVEAGVAYVRFAADRPGHFRVMFDRQLVGVDDGELLPEAVATRMGLRFLVDRVLEAGHAPGIEAEELVMLCWSTVHGYAHLMVEKVLQTDEAGLSSEVEELGERVVRALGALLR